MLRRSLGCRTTPSGYALVHISHLSEKCCLISLQNNIIFGAPYDEVRYNQGTYRQHQIDTSTLSDARYPCSARAMRIEA